MWKIFRILIFMNLIPLWGISQKTTLNFDYYDNKAGLSHNHVYAISQDQQGYMWFGTPNGLNKFDGYTISTYYHSPNDSNSLSNNTVRNLLSVEDELWIGTPSGITVYHTATESMKRLPRGALSHQLWGNQVSKMVQDGKGNIWVGYFGDGIEVVSASKKIKLKTYNVAGKQGRQLKSNTITDLVFLPDSSLLVGTFDGLEVIDQFGKVLLPEDVAEFYPWVSQVHQSVSCLYYSSHDTVLWIGTEENGLYKINLNQHTLYNYHKGNSALHFNYITSLKADRQHNLWIGSEALYLYNSQSNRFTVYSREGIPDAFTQRDPVYAIYEDRDNNVWLGRMKSGVAQHSPNKTNISHFHRDQGLHSLHTNKILSFEQDHKKRIWIGSDGKGLYRFDRKEAKFEQVNATFNKLKAEVIKCIYEDDEGYLWMGTWNEGLLCYHPDKKEYVQYTAANSDLKSLHIWDIQPDQKGNLWLGTLRDGICYFDRKAQTFTYFQNKPTNPQSLANNDILCLLVDSKNTLWVGTSNGIDILDDEQEGIFSHIHQNSPPPYRVSNNSIICMIEDSYGRVWAGTQGGGINVLDSTYRLIKVINEEVGLHSDAIMGLQFDHHGNLWASSFNGIAKIDTMHGQITEIPQFAGLQGKEFLPRSSFCLDNGSLLFGGANGLNLLNPDSLQIQAIPLQVTFTNLKIFNQKIFPNTLYDQRELLSQSLASTQQLHLSYKDYSFTVEFSPLTYNFQNNVKFAYYLENLDSGWQYTSSERRYVHYSNLSPGTYTLKVKATLDTKHWPEHASTLKIVISPPFTQTWWFKACMAFSAILLVYTLIKIRTSYLKQQKDKLETEIVKRTHELRSSNHELVEKHKEIKAQNEEIQTLLDEVAMQRDKIDLKNQALETAQTELKEMNNDLELMIKERTSKLNHTLKELETFLYRASHDLRGPISTMLGILKLAHLENDANKLHLYITHFENTSLNLERTLQKLLTIYSLQKNLIKTEKISQEKVEDILQSLTYSLPGFQKEYFHVNFPSHFQIITDIQLLKVILSNLLENAFCYNQHSVNKNVEVNFILEHEHYKIEIKDYGAGIKNEIKDKIFDMFYRGNVHSKGNGLGLYLARKAVQKLHGEIDVDSKPEEYTCFKISLPRNEFSTSDKENSSQNLNLNY
ncbi:two-component regulator propeller domain-containing protein [Rapidithrix thailandica]|uniref:histidine kinase n=1 Tax=Rapidithrix thailandica TaxID=413964 RepID=A0AAW9SF55_9BACT